MNLISNASVRSGWYLKFIFPDEMKINLWLIFFVLFRKQIILWWIKFVTHVTFFDRFIFYDVFIPATIWKLLLNSCFLFLFFLSLPLFLPFYLCLSLCLSLCLHFAQKQICFWFFLPIFRFIRLHLMGWHFGDVGKNKI